MLRNLAKAFAVLIASVLAGAVGLCAARGGLSPRDRVLLRRVSPRAHGLKPSGRSTRATRCSAAALPRAAPTGDTSSSSTSIAFIAWCSTTAPRDDLERAIGGDAGQLLARLGGDARQARNPCVRARAAASTIRSMLRPARRRVAGELRERPDRLGRADDVVGTRLRRERARRPGARISAACARSASTASAPGGSSGRNCTVMRPAPSGTDAAASGSSSIRPRSRASRRRCRRAGSGRPPSRTSDAPRGT